MEEIGGGGRCAGWSGEVCGVVGGVGAVMTVNSKHPISLELRLPAVFKSDEPSHLFCHWHPTSLLICVRDFNQILVKF